MLLASTAIPITSMSARSQGIPDHPTITAAVLDHPAGVNLAMHSHVGGQLSIVMRGTLTLSSKQGWWLVPPGLAIWIPSEVPHGSLYSESSTLINVRVPADAWQNALAQCTPVVASELMRQLALEAARLCDGAIPSELREPDLTSLRLIGELLALQMRQPPGAPELFVPHGHDRRLRAVINLLRQNPAASLNLEELAAIANTSTRTLARLFMTETGMTFGRWRDHLRVVTAVDLLARGAPITRVALELGYASSASFTTLFTRRLGAPPRRYMRQWQEASRRNEMEL